MAGGRRTAACHARVTTARAFCDATRALRAHAWRGGQPGLLVGTGQQIALQAVALHQTVERGAIDFGEPSRLRQVAAGADDDAREIALVERREQPVAARVVAVVLRWLRLGRLGEQLVVAASLVDERDVVDADFRA